MERSCRPWAASPGRRAVGQWNIAGATAGRATLPRGKEATAGRAALSRGKGRRRDGPAGRLYAGKTAHRTRARCGARTSITGHALRHPGPRPGVARRRYGPCQNRRALLAAARAYRGHERYERRPSCCQRQGDLHKGDPGSHLRHPSHGHVARALGAHPAHS